MSKLFIVIKRKGRKKPLGAIPANRKATRSQLKKLISKGVGNGLCARVATEREVKTMLLKIRKLKL